MKWFSVNPIVSRIKGGEEIIFRSLEEGDEINFGKFMAELSEDTKELFGPHPLTKEEAQKLCQQAKFSNTLRMVASNSKNEIVGYMVISYPLRESQLQRYENYDIDIIQGRDLCIAPCVSDAYQGKGLGSFMMKETIKIAQDLGAKHIILWQGTQKSNKRAVNYYKKFGFKINAEFERYGHTNYDLTLSLDD
ncbi:MAG: GNAT family N-acetyltransferase [Candidatus Dojkabacteria bacterium]|nr:GNAT family N-acetyltransferase [Candidatus Dojkabacteria bacterium]